MPGSRRPVIIVDDDRDILMILATLLDGEGYQTMTFTSSVKALPCIIASHPLLLITDIMMPVMTGQELVARVRGTCGSDLPIIMMSASANRATVAALPVQAFLSKPFDLDEVIELVRIVLASRGRRMRLGQGQLPRRPTGTSG